MSAPRFEPGEIVTAPVPDNRLQGDKPRPVVLVRRGEPLAENRWMVMGLTTLSHHDDGIERAPCPPQVSLDRACYLWSAKLHGVLAADMGEHIGWANDALVDAIRDLVGLTDLDVEDMRPHARRDRARARRRVS